MEEMARTPQPFRMRNAKTGEQNEKHAPYIDSKSKKPTNTEWAIRGVAYHKGIGYTPFEVAFETEARETKGGESALRPTIV